MAVRRGGRHLKALRDAARRIYKAAGHWYLRPWLVLDVGSGLSSWPHLLATCGFRVTAIDRRQKGWWRSADFNRHYLVLDDDITAPRITGPYGAVTCVSVIEHIPDHAAAIRGMFGLLGEGGHLILTCPYNEASYVDDVYSLPEAGYNRDASYVCQVFSRAEVDSWLSENRAEMVAQEYYSVFDGELWTFGGRTYPPREVTAEDRHHLSCMVIQKA
jgi:2-polyprenyl-3-methyl-5-hydroxy-6-metoxy-1,4-benzoquinol methylase